MDSININKYGYVRVAGCVPKLQVANPLYNALEIIKMIKKAYLEQVQVICFPELSVTGYSCGDLFNHETLINLSEKALEKIINDTKNLDIISIVGMPVKLDNQLFNTAVVIQKGLILGIVPKISIPNYQEFYEKRWFSSGKDLARNKITMLNKEVYIGTNLLFKDGNFCFGIEICEDLWIANSPNIRLTQNGANVIFNLSASNELVGKSEYRKDLIRITSAKDICGYVYTSAGVNESSSDVVFSGECVICEDGNILEMGKRFQFESNIIMADIDINKLMNERRKNKSYVDRDMLVDNIIILFNQEQRYVKLLRKYDKYPFVPSDCSKRDDICEEILNIVAMGLAKRLEYVNLKKTVIGISSGLDSTLAFLIIIRTYRILNIDNKNIIAVCMPGFGTTNKTFDMACKLINRCGASLRIIDIKDSCTRTLESINHGMDNKDITFENVQARERMQILMDIANYERGIVIGTGDLSELVLGYCTYNGDHMSMYSVNSSIPKTLVKYLVLYEGNKEDGIKDIVDEILNMPISPELLPPDENGQIKQTAYNEIGPYVLHDFFIYHFLRWNQDVEKIYYMACSTFSDEYPKEEIKKYLMIFIKRFFDNQFKRDCLPDGVKIGSVGISPRGDLKLASDILYNAFMEAIE